MRLSPRPLVCDRVRGQVSTLLDVDVSELDRRLVAAHLARCADCRAFESSVRVFTQELRAAPLESPSEPMLFSRSRARRRVWLTVVEYSAAAAVLIAMLGVVGQIGPPASKPSDDRRATANLFKTSWQPELELAQIDPAVSTRRAKK